MRPNVGENAQAVLLLGLLVISGLGAASVATRFGLPRVAAYVLAGAASSDRFLGGALGVSVGPWTEPLTATALGLIAYLIGGSITVRQVRLMGRVILGSALGEALGAALFVFVAVWLAAPRIAGLAPMHVALALGSIAATTAPAATIAVIHEYRARGPLTSTLLGVVAVDDALGVILFSVMLAATVGGPVAATVGSAVASLAASLLLGIAAGKGLAMSGARVRRVVLRLPLALGALMLVVGLAEVFGIPSLLAAMSTGFFARLFSRAAADRLFLPVEFVEEAVLVLFFTLAGAHFDPAVFVDAGGVIAAYFLARVAGKVVGATAGAKLTNAPPAVERWLGVGLVPQAGVAIGLALSLQHAPAFAEGGRVIVNVVLGTTLLYEIVGPLATRWALARADELRTRRAKEGTSA